MKEGFWRTVTVRLTKEQDETLRQIADEQGLTYSAALRNILVQGFDGYFGVNEG